VVKTAKPAAPSPEEALDTMCREADEILAKTAALLREVDELAERSRQLRAANRALLDRRRKNRGGAK
jgi:hypothetical protein